MFFSNNNVKLLLKWSKNIQTRDQVKVITLPKLDSCICPYQALRQLYKLYKPGDMEPLFQIYSTSGSQVMTDSRARKMLSTLNQAMGLTKNFYTFHCFRRSDATLAYKNVYQSMTFSSMVPGRRPAFGVTFLWTVISVCGWRRLLVIC